MSNWVDASVKRFPDSAHLHVHFFPGEVILELLINGVSVPLIFNDEKTVDRVIDMLMEGKQKAWPKH